MEELYDVVIIGAGASGLTTALYTARANLKTLIIEKGVYGGQMQNTAEIENYSGFKTITGEKLSEQMYEQAISQGAEYIYGDVKYIKQLDNGYFEIGLRKKVFISKAVVISTGVEHRRLGVGGEDKLAGRGVSYCAICDGAFFKGKHVVVVGGGDSALEESVYLSQFAEKVTIIHRRDKFRGQAILQERVYKNEKIHTIIMNAEIVEINGNEKVESVIVKSDLKDAVATYELKCDGVFIYVGLNPVSDIAKPLGIVNDNGYIITDDKMQTSINGIFAVGDVRDKHVRQVATAVGDGAIAGVEISNYIENLD